MGTVTVNGNVYKGESISIVDGVVKIDGKVADSGVNPPKIEISVVGDVKSLEVDNAELLNISGNVGSLSTVNGNVKCGDILGSVSTVNGNVKAETISGAVKSVNGKIKHN